MWDEPTEIWDREGNDVTPPHRDGWWNTSKVEPGDADILGDIEKAPKG